MRVPVLTPSKSYDVQIESGIAQKAGEIIARLAPASSYFVITDQEVASRYLDQVLESFEETVPVYSAVIEAGEASKSFQSYEQLLQAALSSGLDRKSVVIALGGGVVGDIAGFVAGTYMRGVRFVQMPTTLLAHDSSVGGKVAINLPAGKNMVGVFHQPEAVLYDTSLLYTLPEKEWRSGFAEIVKLGLIRDFAFYQWLNEHVKKLTTIEPKSLDEMVRRAIEIKAEIVAEDEKEEGIRAYLNLGHTLGHALESALGYGTITHGEAIAIGTLFAMRMSEKFKPCTLPIAELTSWYQTLGYQTEMPAGLDAETLLSLMQKDKKATAGTIVMVLLDKVGSAYTRELDQAFVRECLLEEMGV
ncbi:3-dehydroquinate synthase [Shouchella shacheensis]|uniref:3-dehydroquinate synthase n=1 Tax=Shouchella shacheensis TaxID=1649580 RepID=UPI00073FEE7B|nr:3-dehydroquinate synthase [Shouchella shacheensis]